MSYPASNYEREESGRDLVHFQTAKEMLEKELRQSPNYVRTYHGRDDGVQTRLQLGNNSGLKFFRRKFDLYDVQESRNALTSIEDLAVTSSNKPGEGENWSRARLIDELVIWFMSIDVQIDEGGGHRRSKYERQAEFILYRVRLYKPPPVFIINVSDFDYTDSRMYGPIMTLKKELLKLDLQTLDDVMKESIVRLFENIDERYYKLNVNKKHISWEFKE